VKALENRKYGQKETFQRLLVTIASKVILLGASLATLSGIPVGGQEKGVSPVHSVDGSFVREWLVLGPFPSKEIQPDFLGDLGGEANVRPKEGEIFARKDGTRLKWTRLISRSDLQDLEQAVELPDFSVAYAYCELKSERPLDTYLRAYTSGEGVMWVNGQNIGHTVTSLGPPNIIPPVQPIHLKGGNNPFLLKLNAQNGRTELLVQPLASGWTRQSFKIIDPAGNPAAGALIQFYKEGELCGQLNSDNGGKAEPCVPRGLYHVRVTAGQNGVWLPGTELSSDREQPVEAQLKNALSIHGQVLAMNRTPQSAIVVQATRVQSQEGKSGAGPLLGKGISSFSETVLSQTNGDFQFVNLPAGNYRVRCQGPNGLIDPEGSGERKSAPTVLDVQEGGLAGGLVFRFPEAKKGVWKNYQLTEGLREVQPKAIHRMRDGSILIGTDQSFVYAYDGMQFKMVASAPEVPANEITDVKQGMDGAVWIGTEGGLARLANGQVALVPFPESAEKVAVRGIMAEQNGSVWFATSEGLFKYDGKQIARFQWKDGLRHGPINSVLRARDGVLWMGTPQGLARFDGNNFSVLQPSGGFCARGIGRLHQSKDGAIWLLAEHGGGVYRYDGKNFQRFGLKNGLLSDSIQDIAETSDGTAWFATDKGLCRFNGRSIINYVVADGLSNEWVRDIFVDSDDVLWCANGWGVSRFDSKGLIRFSQRDGLDRGGGPPEVFTILPEPDGNLLIGTGWAGVFRISGGAVEPLEPWPFGRYVRQIRRGGDGVLWFGTSSGIAKQEHGQVTRILERSWVLALCQDRPGNIWYGDGWNGGGVTRYNPITHEETIFRQAQGLPDDQVWALEAAADGGVWIGTGAGLARYHGGKIENVDERLGLPKRAVYHIRRDAEDALWAAGRGGLTRVKGDECMSITTTNGLPGQHLWCSARTADGKIWMASDLYGLLGFDGKAVTMLDKRDGMAGNGACTVVTNRDNSLWVGFLDGGLTRYEPSKLRPSVQLQVMLVDDQTVTNLANPPAITVGHRVTFQYQEIDQKTHPDKRQFWYRLATQSGSTVSAAVTRERRFDWVPAKGGRYSFEVQAIDRDLNYSQPAQVAMAVIVPWHANAWITVPGSIAVFGLLIWGFVGVALYLRKSREAVRLRERVRIAQDLHDHLGAGLTHLAMVGDMVRHKLDEPHAVQLLATRLSESARELTRTMGEVIWATDAEKDTLRSFALFLTRYAERLFADSPLRVRFDVPGELPDVPLPGEVRNSLFMVAKEALNNVTKHAKASEVWIRLELLNREMHLRIEDDGQGFSQAETGSSGHGLANMQKRLSDLGGELHIDSTPGKGTRVHAALALPRK
jgi:signal transduction histidine kinase/ligand-binding sensor domain-containing protein